MKNILFLSHTFMGGSFVVGSHHLSKELVKRGNKVLHVSAPYSWFHIISKNDENKLRKELRGKFYSEGGVENLIPNTFLPKEMFHINKVSKFEIRKIVKKISNFFNNETIDIVLIDSPYFYPIIKHLNCLHKVYRPTDVYSHMEGSRVIKFESEATSLCKKIIATSTPVKEHLIDMYSISSENIKVISNGVDETYFLNRTNKKNDRETFIYAGAFDSRFDFDMLEFLVKENPTSLFQLIGPGNNKIMDLSKKYDNISYLGKQKYEKVIEYLMAADYGLLLTSDNPANKGRSPMKLYEYGLAGLKVLARKTPELQNRNEEFVFLYDDDSNISQVLESCKNYSMTSKEIKKQSLKESWKGKVDNLLTFIYS
ncbi:glycosyltransferase [Peribacillus frigoritolerans]|uniref:glycosyltransferase n=1 Tax=Peribacillus frigoritolerans TaxID=450367 RepID=UPI00330661F9